MNLTYEAAQPEDIEPICLLCEQLIRRYEDLDSLDFGDLSRWVRKKVKSHIGTYTAVFADGQKAGYYHFYRNEDGQFELDDLYIFPEFQNRGIGSAIIRKCCAQAQSPVMLYCFIRNQRALTLYKRMGFEIVRTVTDSRYIMQNDNCQRKYYAAYDERYKTAHALGVSWSGDVSTPIVMDVLQRYRICRHHSLLEIGCGEGRDSRAVLDQGYDLTATDLSPEAIRYCREKSPQYARHFRVLDCLSDSLVDQFDFIFAIAVIHMLVVDDDRDGFYRFFAKHLKHGGIGLICSMGDGTSESQSDISQAFTLQERNHESGKMLVAGTSCRVVSFPTFEAELTRNGLDIIEKGITSSLPNFDRFLYAVVRKT